MLYMVLNKAEGQVVTHDLGVVRSMFCMVLNILT